MRVQRVAQGRDGVRRRAAREMSTPRSRRRWWGRAGCTLMPVARVTGQFCPPRSPHNGGRPGRERRTAANGTRRVSGRHRADRAPPAPQLLAVVPVDGPPGQHRARGPTARGRPRAAFPPGVERCRARLAELLGPEPGPVPLELETLESVALRRLPARQGRLRHRGHHVGAGLPPRARRRGDAPGAAVLACHGHGPGKGQVVGLEHTDMPERRLRAPAGPAGVRRAGARPAVFRRAPGLESRGPLRLRHEPGPRRHGRVEPAGPERLGPRRCLDVLAAHPLVDPGPHRHGRASPTAAP